MKNIIRIFPLLFSLIFASQLFGQRYAVFPHFANGGGWSSQLFFANQGTSLVSGIIVSFYGQNGQPLVVDSNLGNVSSLNFDLVAGATQVIRIIPNENLVTGYVVVQYPEWETPVRGSEVFRYEQNGTVLAEVGVPQQEIGDHFSFPVEINKSQGINTPFALVNISPFSGSGSMDETVLVNLIRPDGSIRETAQLYLNSGQHDAGYPGGGWLFPNIDNFEGSISVSGPLGVGVLALRQDKQANGAIATDGGPILGPFVLNSVVVYESEPNDYIEEANPISGSTIIDGAIGADGDYDYFAFSGIAGDVISVICETPDPNSYLDSVLAIYNSNLQLIAYNDQNGLAPDLYPENDSFIQLAIPEDGTYYIELTDYYGYGDPGDTYTLHIKLK
jgi:hypothetical protein